MTYLQYQELKEEKAFLKKVSEWIKRKQEADKYENYIKLYGSKEQKKKFNRGQYSAAIKTLQSQS